MSGKKKSTKAAKVPVDPMQAFTETVLHHPVSRRVAVSPRNALWQETFVVSDPAIAKTVLPALKTAFSASKQSEPKTAASPLPQLIVCISIGV